MRLTRLSLLAVVFVFGAGSVNATPAEEEKLEQMAVAYNAKVDNDRRHVVCEMVSKVGTRIKQPQCRTRTQIEHDEDEAFRFAKKPKLSFKSN